MPRTKKRKKSLRQQNGSTRGDGRKCSFWDLGFDSQPSMDWESEDTPYRKTWEIINSEISLVEFFMTKSENTNRHAPEVEVVMIFCQNVSIQELESACPLATLKHVSLLDDRTNDERASVPRPYLGPLNAYKLYLELKKKRFRCRKLDRWDYDSQHSNSQESDGQKPDGQAGAGETQLVLPDADRRIIYITDLDPWSMMAIIATASINQARELRESFSRYLTFDSFIGTRSPYNGASPHFQTFRLGFDLPHWVFRQAMPRKPPRDHRGKDPNSTLRHVIDLSFLTRTEPGSSPPFMLNYLCESQVSVLVTGPDPWRWTAYGFVDTYFDEGDSEESVDAYHEDRDVDEVTGIGIQPDPLTAREKDATLPIKGPREYFLAVLQAQLKHIKAEWQILVGKLKKLISEYIKTCPILTAHRASHRAEPGSIMRSYTWAFDTMDLLGRLAQTLKATIKQLEAFKADTTFATIDERACSSHMPTIFGIAEDFRKYLQDLDFLADNCNYYAKRLSFHLNYEGTHEAKTQASIAEYGQNMAFVMLFIFTPIALAANVLSMQPTVIPAALKFNGTTFVILVIIFAVLVWSAVGVRRNWERIKQYVKNVLKPDAIDRDLEYQEN